MTRRHVGAALPRTVLIAAAISPIMVTVVNAQSARLPDEAKPLLVRIHTRFATELEAATVQTLQLGSGVILGRSGDVFWIATAKHVVRHGPDRAAVWAFLPYSSKDSIQATVVGTTELDSLIRRDADIALIRIVVPPSVRADAGLDFTRLGSARDVRAGDPVFPLGCPQDACGVAPSPPDRVVSNDGKVIAFYSSVIAPGSSGGPLFNVWGEVAGVVLSEARGVGEAAPIDTVLRLAREWNVQPDLGKPFVPRAGYRTRIGVTLLVPTASLQERIPDGRLPSGRLTLGYDVLPALSLQVGGLRLTPVNMTVNALTVGIGARLRYRRLTATPFMEAGFARIEAQYAVGGYLVQGGTPIPVWDRAEEDHIGGGGGLTLEFLAFPNTILELAAGYWGFSTPKMPGIDEQFAPAPTLPHIYVGGGLRLGL